MSIRDWFKSPARRETLIEDTGGHNCLSCGRHEDEHAQVGGEFFCPEFGSERRPIVKRSDGPPSKYQCVSCRKWYVESVFALMRRDMDDRRICEDCHQREENEAWRRQSGEWDREWDQVLKP